MKNSNIEGIKASSSRKKINKLFATVTTSLFLSSKKVQAKEEKKNNWKQITLPVDTVLFDLDFVKNSPEHGWLVGSKGTFLESVDGGENWIPRTFANLDPDEELTYRFENISFFGDDGWVIGKPAIMLHTKDGGKSWLRVPVSPKLPGEPISITALGPDMAEMTTSSGAVYVTDNGGRNWKAQVKETIDSTLNRTISSGVSGASYFTGSVIGVIRDTKGKYMAISSRGNFFLTWEPGQEFWIPRARDTSRRIQSMGFIQNNSENGIWMSTRGGGLSFTGSKPDLTSVNPLDFSQANIKTGGYGILDVSYRTEKEIWAACGGGTLYKSLDNGKNW
eukprot:CAMPEP_0184302222 /NCGR_PEP_ID=MMETSP1049-20130417/12260_1 /TAXON_ID=77928 /ORGANISM="Proteomonas sulcata, Strain CCMP704" /LENGTH=333 /DNA_ID=CAMNT_0026613461 /DNA_START=1851 /DNA_END=2849 /DNA_ORIENTATION=+